MLIVIGLEHSSSNSSKSSNNTSIILKSISQQAFLVFVSVEARTKLIYDLIPSMWWRANELGNSTNASESNLCLSIYKY